MFKYKVSGLETPDLTEEPNERIIVVPEQQVIELRLEITMDPATADSLDIEALQSNFLLEWIQRWLREGCTRLLHLAGQSVCKPTDDEVTTPGEGYHEPGSCEDEGNACPVFEYFERPSALLSADSDNFWVERAPANAGGTSTLDVRWRLTVGELATLGLVAEGASLAPRETAIPDGGSLRVTGVSVTNPLYDSVQRRRAHEGEPTKTMVVLDDLWQSFLRPRSVEALQKQLSGPDGLRESIRPKGAFDSSCGGVAK